MSYFDLGMTFRPPEPAQVVETRTGDPVYVIRAEKGRGRAEGKGYKRREGAQVATNCFL